MLPVFIAALRETPPSFPPALRLKRVQGSPGVWELTYAADGRATFSTPGRIFIVGPSHSFQVFAEAIDAAFAPWDLSHLHAFTLTGDRLICFPDDTFAPDVVWLDHAKLEVGR